VPILLVSRYRVMINRDSWASADLGDSSKHSSEILEGRSEKGFHVNSI